jgi:hypothetical protein
VIAPGDADAAVNRDHDIMSAAGSQPDDDVIYTAAIYLHLDPRPPAEKTTRESAFEPGRTELTDSRN